MAARRIKELTFNISQESDGGFVAECRTDPIITQGDTWERLRAMIQDAVHAFFFDALIPQRIRLIYECDETWIFLQ